MFKAFVGSITCGVVVFGCFIACNTGPSADHADLDTSLPSQGAGESTVTTVVSAGEASADLGVARWEATDDGIYGVQSDGTILAEFHTGEQGVESVLPEAALYVEGQSAFPKLTQEYYDAFAADAQDATPTRADASAAVVPSTLVDIDCYVNLTTCFQDRDAIFANSGIVCVCQPPSLFNSCQTAPFLVDLSCNL
jgi:hypothetical protein